MLFNQIEYELIKSNQIKSNQHKNIRIILLIDRMMLHVKILNQY